MRYRALLLLLFAIVLGALAAYMVNSVVTQQVAQPVETIPLSVQPAVVAVTDLPIGLPLERVHMRIVELPEEAYPANSFTSIDELFTGEQPIVVVPMSVGEVILPIKLSTGIQMRGLTTRIPDGARAVSIPVNEVRGVSGFVLPGDRVDVLHTTTIGRRDDRPVTRTLMQDMTVLGVDQISSVIEEEAVVVNVVTLLVDPEQGKKLTLAQQVGDLTLVLRNEGDRDEDGSATVSLDDLWDYGPEDFQPRRSSSGSGGSGSATSSTASRNLVEVIRGLQIRQQPVGPDGTAVDTNDLN